MPGSMIMNIHDQFLGKNDMDKKKAVYGDWMVVRGFRAYINRATEAPLRKYFDDLLKWQKWTIISVFFPPLISSCFEREAVIQVDGGSHFVEWDHS